MHVQLVVHSLLCTLLVQFGRNSGLWRRFHVWRYVRCYVVLIMIKLWTYLLSLVKVAFRPVRIDFYLENPPSPSHSHISVTYESSSYSYFVLLRGVGRNCFIYYLKSETNWDSGVILHFNNNGEVMLIKIQADATICRYLFAAKLLLVCGLGCCSGFPSPLLAYNLWIVLWWAKFFASCLHILGVV